MSFTYPDRCFLSAVRADGFCSLLADAASGYERVYILYGAAGTGRAQAMTAAAGKLLSHGAEIWAAVDPLDPKRVEGVFAPSAGVAVISGDFPHLICAVRPCLREITVDFNAACSAKRLQSEIDAVETVYSARDSLYARASRYMSAASSLLGDSFRIAADCTDGKKAAQFAMMSTARLLGRRQKRSGTERLCYLSAVTPDGIAFDGDALVSAADSLLIIDDDYGACDHDRGAAHRAGAWLRHSDGAESAVCRRGRRAGHCARCACRFLYRKQVYFARRRSTEVSCAAIYRYSGDEKAPPAAFI